MIIFLKRAGGVAYCDHPASKATIVGNLARISAGMRLPPFASEAAVQVALELDALMDARARDKRS